MVQFNFAKMNLKQIFITFAFSFIFWMCSNNEPTAELLEAFGTPPVVNKITSQEFLEQGEAIFEDGEDIEKTVSSERIFYVQKSTLKLKTENSVYSTQWPAILKR